MSLLLTLAPLSSGVRADSNLTHRRAHRRPVPRVVRLLGSVRGLRLPRARIVRWVDHSAHTVARYYGRFPASRVDVSVRRGYGRRVGAGRTHAGRRIVIRLGRRVSSHALDRDWVLVHELLHTTFPRLARRHRWMREGLATYLEPILRARAGDLSEREVWARFASGLPQGLPRRGDRGLDRTPSWGRVYWGGTLYWLLADMGIRRQTHGRRSLRDALRAIAAAGGNGRVVWPMARVLRVGDRATGTHVMSRLYRRMARSPHPVDLRALLLRLGVHRATRGRAFALDHTAPMARLRRAIVRGR